MDGSIVIARAGERNSRAGMHEASITFPSSLSELLSGPADVGLALSYYSSPVLFPYSANDTEDQSNVTSVVSASFVGHDITNLEDDVIITLKLDDDNYEEVVCVSWDFQANGKPRLVNASLTP